MYPLRILALLAASIALAVSEPQGNVNAIARRNLSPPCSGDDVPVLSGHVFRLRNKASGTYLDLNDGSNGDGTKIQGWARASDDERALNQMWRLDKVDQGSCYFTLVNLHSGTYMDLNDGDDGNGVKVQGWDKAYNGNQYWSIIKSSGAYKLVNHVSGTCLDLNDGSTGSGTKVQGWECKDVDAQVWEFERTSFTGSEIRKTLYPIATDSQMLQYSNDDGTIYMAPPSGVVEQLYKTTRATYNIEGTNDGLFTAAMHAAVDLWIQNNVAITVTGLVGIVWGTTYGVKKAVEAYNFMVLQRYVNDNYVFLMIFFNIEYGIPLPPEWAEYLELPMAASAAKRGTTLAPRE